MFNQADILKYLSVHALAAGSRTAEVQQRALEASKVFEILKGTLKLKTTAIIATFRFTR